MALPLDRDQIQQLTEELEVIIAAHLAWFKQLNRVLVCGSEPPAADILPDAHLRSPFGVWYYTQEPHPLAEYAAFQELAAIQQAMHAAARRALAEVAAGRRPAPELYDQCIDLALRLNTRLRNLQLDIIGELLTTDALTGCSARRGMLARLREEQERARRIQRPCCICLMDFDRFKRINDELGHPAGDAVLRQGMRFTAAALRKYDSIYRYGGEEFLICLPGTPLRDAAQVIERIRQGLAQLPIRLASGATLNVTASFGLAELHPARAVEESIANADLALIRAKEGGRNRVEIWQE
ncbi:MAG: diguanylate cyclase [Thiobacillaceae bacterium]|nr:diguanylate cyclase [Thiobacillaceae bacterium]MCX7673907.1 diguanylate cyclase [Thiobacillaceae bacterium]